MLGERQVAHVHGKDRGGDGWLKEENVEEVGGEAKLGRPHRVHGCLGVTVVGEVMPWDEGRDWVSVG